jgi:hypothetical protein
MDSTADDSKNDEKFSVLQAGLALPTIRMYLPPWTEATSEERCKLALYKAAIYAPVFFLILVVLSLYCSYISFFVADLVSGRSDPPELYYWQTQAEHEYAIRRGWCWFSLMTALICLFAVSWVRACLTGPGYIPQTGEWDPEDTQTANVSSVERKKDGTYRVCARCVKLKPDRSHHCRLCDVCVLKMDHHCPWIANCVGYLNYKYFILTLTYAVCCLWLYSATFWEALVVNIYDTEASPVLCLSLVMLYSFACLLTLAITAFWVFHINLIKINCTTIEFIEKSHSDSVISLSHYSLSTWDNFKAALGPKWWLWLVPCGPGYRCPTDAGVKFRTRFDFA